MRRAREQFGARLDPPHGFPANWLAAHVCVGWPAHCSVSVASAMYSAVALETVTRKHLMPTRLASSSPLATRSTQQVVAILAASVAALASSCAPGGDSLVEQRGEAILSATTPALYQQHRSVTARDALVSNGVAVGDVSITITPIRGGVLRVFEANAEGHTMTPSEHECAQCYINVLPADQQSEHSSGNPSIRLESLRDAEGNWSRITLTAMAEGGRTYLRLSNYVSSAHPEITVEGDWFPVAAYATATDVQTSGTAAVDSPLTGSYTYTGAFSAAEGSSLFQWYSVDGALQTPITGATSLTFAPPAALGDSSIRFCVSPASPHGRGFQSCSPTRRVPHAFPQLSWFTEPNQQGAAIVQNATEASNGQCIPASSIGGPLRSYRLTGSGVSATLKAFYTTDCTNLALLPTHSKSAAADTTVGYTFPTSFVVGSYRVRW